MRRLPEAGLRHLALTLLADLKEARERLAQTPQNRSRPPSSRSPWECGVPVTALAPEETEPPAAVLAPEPFADAERPAAAPALPAATGTRQAVKGKPGKQWGTSGVGRTQALTAQTTPAHRQAVCARCGQARSTTVSAVSNTGFQSLDLDWGDPAAPGLRLLIVDHRCNVCSAGCIFRVRLKGWWSATTATASALAIRCAPPSKS